MLWIDGGEVFGIVLLLLVLALAALTFRRRWLARGGGTFECSLRLNPSVPNAGWVLGVGRYSGEYLQWYRSFSYSVRPRLSFPRTDVRVTESRDPDPVEAVALYSDQRVVALEVGDDCRTWELAMSNESLTGMLSWLEAAPPGVTAP